MWAQVMVCLVLGGTASSLQCPDGRTCEGPSICCKLPGWDGYSCCDQPQFTEASLRMLSPNSVNEVSGVVCPDGSLCPAEYSCLRTSDAAFACCPWDEAISCADGRHCCPRGSHCSADGQSCFQSQVVTSPAIVTAVQCPDGESECPNDSTCCMMPDGAWGCCPMPEAACCADKVHCCPHATICDLEHARCFSASGEQPLQEKFPARKRMLVLALPQRIYQDNQPACPDTATHCLLLTNQYGCCPLQNAVCCSDHLHCCPLGTTCDLEHSKCAMTPRWSWPMTRLHVDLQTAHDVQCSAKYKCPDGNTCCRKASGGWGCCPLLEAVCCSDGAHCCPKGYQCNLAEGTCIKESKSIPWPVKMSTSSTVTSAGNDVQCDSHTSCPDGHTCCLLQTGAWGCCPLPKAVCCLDHIHCCPSGYHCDPSKGTCLVNGDSIPWLEKKPAISSIVPLSQNVRCDDRFSCADGQTCCQKNTGAWACCPFPQAVCCNDHVHCCPVGYTCDVQHGTCTSSAYSSPWIATAPILSSLEKDVKCDDQTSCMDGQTCCRLASGQWGCCPFAEAVCCLDQVHCCPKGYTCDPKTSTCKEAQHSLPWAPKHPASPLQSRGIHCNDTVSCEEGQTCCKSASGGWACCQLPNAVCCEDHQHCCPSGYTCNVAAQTCEKQLWPRPLAAEPPSVSLSSPHVATSGQDVQCDAQHYCHDRQTCCQASSGGWACCPYDKGFCCPDKLHCCPSGFRCSQSGLECHRHWSFRWDTIPFSPRLVRAQPLA